MKIRYELEGVNDFHNQGPVNLIVSGKTDNNLDGYIITPGQNRRLENHFCGVAGCGCAKGAAYPTDEAGTQFVILKKYCTII